MTLSRIEAFNKWSRKVPESSRALIELVQAEVVPRFAARGLVRHPDYGGNNAYAVGANCIPLQRRSGEEWPTVEIAFDPKMRPSCNVTFAMLPEVCTRHLPDGRTNRIPRMEANVVEGRAFFLLCKGRRSNADCMFGYQWWTLRPQQRLARDVDSMVSLLPWLFDVFDRGIPPTWLTTAGYVAEHAFLSRASNVFDERPDLNPGAAASQE